MKFIKPTLKSLLFSFCVLAQQNVVAASDSYSCEGLSSRGTKINFSLNTQNTARQISVHYVIRGAEPKDDMTVSVYTTGSADKNNLNLSLSSDVSISQWVDNTMEETKHFVMASPVAGFVNAIKGRLTKTYRGQAVLPLLNGNQKMSIECKKSQDTPPIRGCLFCT